MPLTDSLAHHFLDYVHFCVRCARFMRKFAPTKTFKTPSKSFKTTTKTIKRQKPSNAYKSQKTRSHLSNFVFLHVLGNMQKNGKNVRPSAFFLQSSHRIMFLEEAWSWLQVWTLCVCVHITMRIGMHGLVCGRPFETRLFPWAKSIINSGGRGVTENSRLQWRA